MPRRVLGDIAFIKAVPSIGGGRVTLRITASTSSAREEIDRHVHWWHEYVQPVIRQQPGRADAEWDWRRIWWVNVAASAAGQRPVLYVACVARGNESEDVPCALVHLVGRYPALNKHDESAVYLWYLSEAPRLALERLRAEDRRDPLLLPNEIPKMLGTMALDIAVTHSFRDGLCGRLGLHAAEAGGSDLCRWYETRGLTNLPATEKLPPGLRRMIGNDGRYYYYAMAGAYVASRALDPFR